MIPKTCDTKYDNAADNMFDNYVTPNSNVGGSYKVDDVLVRS